MSNTTKLKIFLSADDAELEDQSEALIKELREDYSVISHKDLTEPPEDWEEFIRDDCDACIFLVDDKFEAQDDSHPGRNGHSDVQWQYILAARHNKARFLFAPADSKNGNSLVEQKDNPNHKRHHFFSIEHLTDQVRALNLNSLNYTHSSETPLDEGTPYQGLRLFEEADRNRFFGREEFLNAFDQTIEDEALSLVTGHSGSGKSSVLQAGVIPLWKNRQKKDARVIIFSPGTDPFYSLFESLCNLGVEEENCEWVKEGHADVFYELHSRIPELKWKMILVVIDRFEEIFTLVPSSHKEKVRQFVAALASMQRKASLTIVLGMNDQYYPCLERHRTLCAILDQDNRTMRLMSPTESELKAMIEAPAIHNGVKFEDGLVQQIINDFNDLKASLGQERSYLPLLQFTLKVLWKEASRDNSLRKGLLTAETYHRIGTLKNVIEGRFQGFFNGLGTIQTDVVERLFKGLVKYDPVTKTHQFPRVKRSELIHNFTDASILEELVKRKGLIHATTTEHSNGQLEHYIELGHGTLLDIWPRLRGWISTCSTISDTGEVSDIQERIKKFETKESLALSNLEKAKASQVSAESVLTAFLAIADSVDAPGENNQFTEIRSAANKHFTHFPPSPELLRDRVTSSIEMTESLIAKGSLKKALPAAKATVQLLLQLCTAEPENDDYRRDLAMAHDRLGNVKYSLKSPKEAMSHYESYKKIIVDLHGKKPTPKRTYDLSECYTKFGAIAYAKEGPKAALAHYEKAHELAIQLHKDEQSTAHQRLLAVSNERMGDIKAKMRDNLIALHHFQKFNKLMMLVHEADSSPSNTRALAVSHSKLGDIKLELKDNASAMEHFRIDLKLTNDLYQADQGDDRCARDLAISHGRIGVTLQQIEGPKAALKHFQKKFELTQKLYDKERTTQLAHDLAISHSRLGSVKQILEGPSAALPHLKQRYEILEALHKSNPTPENARSLAISYSKLGTIYLALMKEDTAGNSQFSPNKAKARLYLVKGREILIDLKNKGQLDAEGKVWITGFFNPEIAKLD